MSPYKEFPEKVFQQICLNFNFRDATPICQYLLQCLIQHQCLRGKKNGRQYFYSVRVSFLILVCQSNWDRYIRPKLDDRQNKNRMTKNMYDQTTEPYDQILPEDRILSEFNVHLSYICFILYTQFFTEFIYPVNPDTWWNRQIYFWSSGFLFILSFGHLFVHPLFYLFGPPDLA